MPVQTETRRVGPAISWTVVVLGFAITLIVLSSPLFDRNSKLNRRNQIETLKTQISQAVSGWNHGPSAPAAAKAIVTSTHLLAMAGELEELQPDFEPLEPPWTGLGKWQWGIDLRNEGQMGLLSTLVDPAIGVVRYLWQGLSVAHFAGSISDMIHYTYKNRLFAVRVQLEPDSDGDVLSALKQEFGAADPDDRNSYLWQQGEVIVSYNHTCRRLLMVSLEPLQDSVEQTAAIEPDSVSAGVEP